MRRNYDRKVAVKIHVELPLMRAAQTRESRERFSVVCQWKRRPRKLVSNLTRHRFTKNLKYYFNNIVEWLTERSKSQHHKQNKKPILPHVSYAKRGKTTTSPGSISTLIMTCKPRSYCWGTTHKKVPLSKATKACRAECNTSPNRRLQWNVRNRLSAVPQAYIDVDIWLDTFLTMVNGDILVSGVEIWYEWWK